MQLFFQELLVFSVKTPVPLHRSGPKFLTTGNEMAEKIIIFIGIIINSVPLIAILKYFDYGLLFAEIDNMESKIYP